MGTDATSEHDALAPSSDRVNSDELELKVKKYLRGNGTNLEVLQDKKLKGRLAIREELYGKSAKAAAEAEKWLMPCEEGFLEAEGLEKTYRIKQEAVLQEVDILSSQKAFDIILPELGPYTLNYSPSGRHMVVGGRKGHLAMLDMKTMDLVKEFQVRETVRDVVFLHNKEFIAVAQKKYPYIYNSHGTELHCLQEHAGGPLKLQFLKNHFLLVSINKYGQLRYLDTTTGAAVGCRRTGLGRCDVMQENPFNSVVGLGHSSGKVTMWKPTSGSPLVNMLCHHGPVTALAFHSGGQLMATAGMDRKLKLWDLRKFEVLRTITGREKSLEFSPKSLLASGNGSRVLVWRDSGGQRYSLYMSHSMVKGYQVGKVAFQPYEDVLGLGHSMGISSILIPGSGEPNFDTWVANPYETTRQQREKEVHALLDKLPPETIMLDPKKIGLVKWTEKAKPTKQEREAEMLEAIAAAKNVQIKKKTKGRNKPSKREHKKKEGVIKAKRSFLEEKTGEEQSRKKQRVDESVALLPKSLQRFARKKVL